MTKLRDRVVQRAAHRYVAGARLEDALALAHSLEHPTTLGYWDAPGEEDRVVVAAHEQAIAAIVAGQLKSYPSVKLPALGSDPRAVEAVAEAAAAAGVLLHFDSLAESEADRTLALACRLSRRGGDVGATLPGCWSRSSRDAEVLAAAGVRIRIVKGQWPGDREPGPGFLAVVDAVGRSGGRTAIATHDAQLAHEALQRVPGAELELLLGLPASAVARLATEHAATVRIYVPYGRGYLPYAVRRAVSQPIMFWWLARDLALRRR